MMTTSIPVATKKHASYENFIATCPICGEQSVFNRASDLCTFEPIAGRDVTCLNSGCGKPFRIIGDVVNARHEMMLYDARDLIEQKRYMHAVLTACTACEAMFSLFLRVELVYRQFTASEDLDLDHLNRLLELLDGKIKELTFPKMRALFLERLAIKEPPESADDAELMIKELPGKPQIPIDAAIEVIPCAPAIPALKLLKQSTIGRLRNQVVHKHAYRPTRQEAESAIDDARSIIHPLTFYLDLHDEINLYLMGNTKSRTRWRTVQQARGGPAAGDH